MQAGTRAVAGWMRLTGAAAILPVLTERFAASRRLRVRRAGGCAAAGVQGGRAVTTTTIAYMGLVAIAALFPLTAVILP